MQSDRSFGDPLFAARPLVSRLDDVSSRRRVVEYWRLLDAASVPGLVLFETADRSRGRSDEQRTVLLPQPLVRVELRQEGCHLQPLAGAEGGGACAERLTAAIDGLPKPPLPEDLDGLEDRERLQAPCLLDALRRLAGAIADERVTGVQPPLAPGWFGAFNYELVDRFESIRTERRPDPLSEPEASLVLGLDQIVADDASAAITVVTRGLPWESVAATRLRHEERLRALRAVDLGSEPPDQGAPRSSVPVEVECQPDDAEFERGVERLQEHIRAGDIFQAVLSRSFIRHSTAPSSAVYMALRASDPSPYMFHLSLPQGALLGASPETFVRVDTDRRVQIRPIAGTAPRGRAADGTVDTDLDSRLALALQNDPKELAEHAMLLDLARNDIARIARPGTMRVVEQFAIERFSRVQHLVSRVEGELDAGLDPLHAYRAAANPGTLTGAPKPRAVELVRGFEATARGFYGGAVGYVTQDGRMDTCIAIRSLREVGGRYAVRAGAGVVNASVPRSEATETRNKARACLEAIAAAELAC